MIYDWVISDLHINHYNIIRYTGRPFDNEEVMNETLIENWNKTVGPKDKVINLGDVGFFRPRAAVYDPKVQVRKHLTLKELLPRLNGEHHLILGNHDEAKAMQYAGFASVSYYLKTPEALYIHDSALVTSEIKGLVICGHVHEQWKTQERYDQLQINVSVEQWDYRPVHFDVVVKKYNDWKLKSK